MNAVHAPVHDRFAPTSPWRSAWGCTWCTARDIALATNVVLIRPAQPLATTVPGTPSTDLGVVRVLGALHTGSDALVVEEDCEQLLLPETLSGQDALIVLVDLLRELAQSDQQDPSLRSLAPDSLRVLRDGRTTWSPVAAMSHPPLQSVSAPDARVDAAGRMAARFVHAVDARDLWHSHVDYMRNAIGAPNGSLAQVANAMASRLEEAGIDLVAARQQLRAAAVSAAEGSTAPAVDHTANAVQIAAVAATQALTFSTPTRAKTIERWSADELATRTWTKRRHRLAAIAIPVLLLFGAFVATVLLANRDDARTAAHTAPILRMRDIALRVSDPVVSVDNALADWDGKSAGSKRMRSAGGDLHSAAKDGLHDANQIKVTSATEAEGLSALKGMLTSEERLGSSMADLPKKNSEVDSVHLQEIALQAKSVATSVQAFNITMSETKQKQVSDRGYTSLPKSSEHALDQAFKNDQKRLTNQQAQHQDSTTTQIEKRLASGWNKRFTPLEKRGNKLVKDAATARTGRDLACKTTLQTNLEGLMSSEQQLVLQVNVSPSPTLPGLDRQKQLVTALETEVSADQLALRSARAQVQEFSADPHGYPPRCAT